MRNLIIVLSFLLIVACKKSDDNNNNIISGPETPLKTAEISDVFWDTTFQYKFYNLVVGNGIELGNKLHFSKNGVITKLGCKAARKGTYKISFWDVTASLLRTTNVIVTDTLQFTYNTVDTLPVIANHTYIISMFSKNLNTGENMEVWVHQSKSSDPSSIPAPDIYPHTIGSVTYETAVFLYSPISVYPSSGGQQHYIAGLADFQFEGD